MAVGPAASDTTALAAALAGADSREGGAAAVAATMAAVAGPWAMIYWQPGRSIWFGRDAMGRRSLLLGRPEPTAGGANGALMITSVAPASCQNGGYRWMELPVTGMFELRLAGPGAGRLLHHPWPAGHSRTENMRLTPALCVPPAAEETGGGGPQIQEETYTEQDGAAVAGLLGVLDEAVRVRVTRLPPPAAAGSAAVGCASPCSSHHAWKPPPDRSHAAAATVGFCSPVGLTAWLSRPLPPVMSTQLSRSSCSMSPSPAAARRRASCCTRIPLSPPVQQLCARQQIPDCGA